MHALMRSMGYYVTYRTAYVAPPGNIAAPEEFQAGTGSMKCRFLVVVYSKVYLITGFEF